MFVRRQELSRNLLCIFGGHRLFWFTTHRSAFLFLVLYWVIPNFAIPTWFLVAFLPFLALYFCTSGEFGQCLLQSSTILFHLLYSSLYIHQRQTDLLLTCAIYVQQCFSYCKHWFFSCMNSRFRSHICTFLTNTSLYFQSISMNFFLPTPPLNNSLHFHLFP